MSATVPPLLSSVDPEPVTLINKDGGAPLVLTCEHAGNAVPACLEADAPPDEDMARHIAYDPGAAEVATALSERLDAALALQPYSRLVIDCNRPRHAPDLAPAISDGSAVGFNDGLGHETLEARWHAIHQPFHQAVADLVATRRRPALVTVHSFTRQLRGEPPRSMALGLIARQDRVLKYRLGEAIATAGVGLEIAYDAPYQIEDISDYTIPVHGEGRGLPHLLLEVRNDLIADADGIDRITDLLSEALQAALSGIMDPM
jgi:predicted N-formylglutamate amidohydrolase